MATDDPHAVAPVDRRRRGGDHRAARAAWRRISVAKGAADLCLAYARGQDWIDGVVVGMETEAQLDANLRLFVRPPLTAQECEAMAQRLPRVPEQLLNPALWPRRT